LERNKPCPCGSGKKHKRCCGKDNAPTKKKNKWIILGASVIILIFSAFGFKKIMDDNRKNANPDAVYCPDCGRYH
tara:strand:+ start:356 stop:580 length:225 start_codon:yes stop_codon:yes gene_type:complete